MKSPIRILCFGDSNTWGYHPKDESRYPYPIRWTGKLQQLLGPDYQIIEEGLNGRTTSFDYRERFGKNGRDYLRPCMDSHCPLDFVILGLGANDTKVEFGLNAAQIADGFEQVVLTALGQGLEKPSPGVRVIIGCPTFIRDAHLNGYAEMMGAEAKTLQLPPLYAAIAKKYDAAFVDLSQITEPSPLDGVHLTEEGHAAIAEAYRNQILKFTHDRD